MEKGFTVSDSEFYRRLSIKIKLEFMIMWLTEKDCSANLPIPLTPLFQAEKLKYSVQKHDFCFWLKIKSIIITIN